MIGCLINDTFGRRIRIPCRIHARRRAVFYRFVRELSRHPKIGDRETRRGYAVMPKPFDATTRPLIERPRSRRVAAVPAHYPCSCLSALARENEGCAMCSEEPAPELG